MKVFLLAIAFNFCFLQTVLSQSGKVKSQARLLVLKGGTIVDVDNYGRTANDIVNSVIVIEGGIIKDIGTLPTAKIPKNAQVVDVTGQFILPGLIDGFGTINDQGYANAYVYNGVTTIVGLPHDNRRGHLMMNAAPSPKIMVLEDFRSRVGGPGTPFRNSQQISSFIDSLAGRGVRVLWVPYWTQPFQIESIVNACRQNKIVTIGELAFTTYTEAARKGINSFVHTSRYAAEILPDSIRKVYNETPFGTGAKMSLAYFENLTKSELPGLLINYAKVLGDSDIALIPTWSLHYSIFPFSKNPWDNAAASMINVDSVFLPLDKKTGKWKEPRWSLSYVQTLLEIDKYFHEKGARYLTGTGTDAFGTLPGISIHTELEMLVRVGLSNREALASATSNFNKIYGWNVGQVRKGSAADLIILKANPVDALQNLIDINLLVMDGKVIEHERLLKK